MMSRALSRTAVPAAFATAAFVIATAALADPPVTPVAPVIPPGVVPVFPRGVGLPPGLPGPVVLEAGALALPPPPPPGAFVFWPMCNDAPCPVGGGGVWVHYPAVPYPPPWGYAPPEPPPPARPKGPGIRNVGLMVAGISLSAVSSVGMLAGLMIDTANDDEEVHALSAIIGLLGIATSIPLMVVGGAKKSPHQDKAPADQASSPLPTVSVGAGSAQLTWQF